MEDHKRANLESGGHGFRPHYIGWHSATRRSALAVGLADKGSDVLDT